MFLYKAILPIELMFSEVCNNYMYNVYCLHLYNLM